MQMFKIFIAIFLLFYPIFVKATETTLGEADNFGDLVSLIWSWGIKIILPISILVLIVSGFMYMASEGNEEKIAQAKEVSSGAIISATILLFSGVLKNVLQKPLQGIETGDADLNSLPQVIQNTSNLMLTFVGAFAVFTLVYNGIQYMFAGGDQEKLDKAKNHSKYAVIGLIIAVLAYYIVDFVISFWIG